MTLYEQVLRETVAVMPLARKLFEKKMDDEDNKLGVREKIMEGVKRSLMEESWMEAFIFFDAGIRVYNQGHDRPSKEESA